MCAGAVCALCVSVVLCTLYMHTPGLVAIPIRASATVSGGFADDSTVRVQEHMAADSPSSLPAFTSPQSFHMTADSR